MANRRQTQQSQHSLDEAQKEVARREKEESTPSVLSDPRNPMEPSQGRHWAYAAVIVFGGLILNVLLIAVLGS